MCGLHQIHIRPEAMVQSGDGSEVGEKIPGHVRERSGDRPPIAWGNATPVDPLGCWSGTLVKEDILGRAGVDRPSEVPLLRMNRCGRQCMSRGVRTS